MKKTKGVDHKNKLDQRSQDEYNSYLEKFKKLRKEINDSYNEYSNDENTLFGVFQNKTI